MSLATELPEAELVRRATDGDRYALDELVRLHERRILALCRSRLRSHEDAADAAQETFARALRRLDRLRDPDAFGPWLRTIAVRVCADHGRKLSRMRSTELDHDTVDDAPSPDELAETAEDHRRVHRALHSLGERDRRALWLRHGVEEPIATVASQLGVTEGSARVLLTRARHRLRDATSAMSAIIPLSWRRWTREHLPAFLERPDLATSLLPAAALAALMFAPPMPNSPPDAAQPQEPIVATPVAEVTEAPEPATQVDLEPAPAPERPAPAPAPAPEPEPPPEPDTQDRPTSPVGRIANDVRVQEGYPEDEPYLAEVQVVGAEESPNTTRLYGDPADDPLGAVEETVGALLGK